MFYYPDGSIINNPKDFIYFYNRCYYLKNSRCAEEQIEKLLEPDHQLSEQDVMMILRWKFGRIDYKQSTYEGRIIYNKKDYIDPVCEKLREYSTWDGYGREVNAEAMCTFIAQHYRGKNTEYDEIYKSLVGQPSDAIKNMGPVYILTLVSFITRGLCPVYDRFALQAIQAIKAEKIKPGQPISIGTLIQDLEKHNTKGIIKLYEDYMNSIKSIFEKFNRDVDRALWFYGHLFNIVK